MVVVWWQKNDRFIAFFFRGMHSSNIASCCLTLEGCPKASRSRSLTCRPLRRLVEYSPGDGVAVPSCLVPLRCASRLSSSCCPRSWYLHVLSSNPQVPETREWRLRPFARVSCELAFVVDVLSLLSILVRPTKDEELRAESNRGRECTKWRALCPLAVSRVA
jgi:hypothetical protein